MASVNDEDLTPTEVELVNHCAVGTLCNLSGRPPDQVRVRASVLYELCVGRRWPVHAKGVQLGGAWIPERLDFENAVLRAPLLLSGCVIAGLTLTSATSSAIELIGCQIDGVVDADMARAAHLSLHRSTVEALNVADASIDGHLGLLGTQFTGSDAFGHSLTASGLRVTDAYLRDGFEATGPIFFVGATISGNLEMDGAKLRGIDARGSSLIADGLHVAIALLRFGFEAAGSVRLVGARVDRELDLTAAKLRGVDADGNSLNADRLHAGGGVVLQHGFEAAGTVRLVGATIDGQLLLHDARIDGLRLTSARCAVLADDQDSWPANGRLSLRGLRFDSVASDADFNQRLDWVRRQWTEDWSTDPYEQLAAYYSSTGDEQAARRMQIAKNDDELAHLKKTSKEGSFGYRFWRRPFGWLLGYGYRRWPAGVLLIVTLVAAGGIFRWAESDGGMVPNEPVVDDNTGDPLPCGGTYPCFNSWVYGADVVLPIIDFGQDDAWRPVETPSADQWWIWARWGFIVMGWVLASVFVAAFTALVQRT
jgi:uncharacterized protein YjbI with pentapeptide repeats